MSEEWGLSNYIFFGRRLHKYHDRDLIELIEERDALREDVEILYKEMVEDDETIISLSKRLAEYEGENKRWHSFETVQAIVKERDELQRKLDIGVEALKYIPCIMVNDGRVWNVDVIEQRIQTIIDDALAEIEKEGKK